METKERMRMAALAACSLLGAVPAQAGISAPTRVVIGLPTASVYWQTAFTNVVPVYWGEYPSAASAILSAALASGPASTETFSASGGDTEWALPGGADEELYELSLRFLDSGGNDVKTLSARVARVKSATPVDMTKDAGDGRLPSWQHARRPGSPTDNAVLAYDAAWVDAGDAGLASLTVTPLSDSGAAFAVPLDSMVGYTALVFSGRGLPYGWYSLLLRFGGGEGLSAEVWRVRTGTGITLR